MPRENRCMYMVHVYFYICCGDCVGVCGNVCCVPAIVKDSADYLSVTSHHTSFNQVEVTVEEAMGELIHIQQQNSNHTQTRQTDT